MTSRRSPGRSEEGAGVSRCCSLQLHPQIKATEEDAQMSRRRSPRPDLQFHSTDEGAGVARCCSLPLHPRIKANEDGAPGAAASLPDDDDMLREMLLRLPPQPSSLPRASAVCKRWRGLVTDPKFHRQFYARHRKPPLLGVFHTSLEGILFTPVLDRPDLIDPERFDFRRYGCSCSCALLDCRHGRVLIIDLMRNEVLVCDPITSEHRRVAIPSEFKRSALRGAVYCAASDNGHVHGGCHTSPFKVVLMSMSKSKLLARVYSSETGGWGNIISTAAPCQMSAGTPSVLVGNYTPSVLVGNCLYWMRDGVPLEFDLVENSLTVISGPPVTQNIQYGNHQIIQTENGALGFAMSCYPYIHIWQRAVNDLGVATWVSWKTIEMHNVLGLPLQIGGAIRLLLWYDHDNDVIFLYVNRSVYAVQLKSMQSKKLYETDILNNIYPFTGFYTPGTAHNGGSNGAEMLHDT